MVAWLKKSVKQELVGLELTSDSVVIACHRPTKTNSIAVHYTAVIDGAWRHQSKVLSDVVKAQSCKNALCNVVLSPGSYQIVLVEAPDVPEEELRDAIKWKLKDIVSIPVNEAVLDVFHLPRDGAKSDKKMVYVVVTQRSLIQDIVEFVAQSGLTLKSIDITEFALRNILLHIVGDDQMSRGVAIVKIQTESATISVYKGGDLYLTRQFDLDYAGGLLDDLPVEGLALQLQRSLDYYERQMGQAVPAAIYICGENITEDKISPTLKASLATPIHYLKVDDTFYEPVEDDELLSQQCLTAVGGALRVDA